MFFSSASCKTGNKISTMLQSDESAARKYFLTEVWEKKFKGCGEYYYACVGCKAQSDYFGNAITAIKTSPNQWTVELIELTPADIANNITWAGNLTVTAEMSTYYSRKTREWMQYWDGLTGFFNALPGAGALVFQIVRYKNGTFSAFINNNSGLLRAWNETDSNNWWEIAPIIDCNEVPPRN